MTVNQPKPPVAPQSSLQAVIDSLFDPFVILNAVRNDAGQIADFEFAAANEAACSFNQRRQDELIGARLSELHPAAFTSGLFHSYCQVVDTGEPLVFSDWLYPQDLLNGEMRRYDVRAVKLDDGISQSWRDVTEVYREREELAELAAGFRLLAENAGDAVVWTESGVAKWVSQSVREVLGWEPDDLIGTDLTSLIHPDDRPAIAAARAKEHLDETDRLRFRVHTRDGAWRWVDSRTRVRVDDSGQRDGFVGTYRDVTAEVAAQAELAESEQRFRLAMTNSAIGMCIVSPEGAFLDVNAALCEFLGRDAGQLRRATWQELTHPDDIDGDLALVADVLAGRRDSYRLRKRFLRPNADVVWGDLSVACVRQEDGSVNYFISQISDVTMFIAARRELIASESNFRLLAENAASIVSRMDNQGIVLWVSASIKTMLGWSPDELIGRSITEILHPDDLAGMQPARGRVSSGLDAEFETRVRRPDGEYRWFHVMLRPTFDEAGNVIGRIAGWRDIQVEHEAREQLARSEELLRTALASAPVGIAVLDLDCRFVNVNPALCRLLDRPESWLLDHELLDVMALNPGEQGKRMRDDLLAGGVAGVTQERRLVTASGDIRWVLHATGILHDVDGQPTGFVAQFADTTDAHMAHEQLRYLATHDPLTGLADRRELERRLLALLTQFEVDSPEPSRICVLFIDLDGLKPLNDTYGHARGDQALKAVAEQVAQLPELEVVARYGGDEFVAVARVPAVTQASELARTISQIARAPLPTDDGEISVSLSIGVAVAEPGESPKDVLHRADAALYRAKAQGRGQAVVAG